RGTMGQLGATPLHHLRRGPICAALFAAFLAVALGTVAFEWRASVGAPRPCQSLGQSLGQSLVRLDSDAKALRPHQELAIRASTRAVRLGSSGDFGVPRAVLLGAQPPPRADGFVAQTLSTPGYLAQRTRCPREPPRAVA